MDFETLQKMNRFAKFWDLYGNSGNFVKTMALFKEIAEASEKKSLFWTFIEFSDFLHTRHPESFGISLLNLLESAWIFLTQIQGISENRVRPILVSDYTSPKTRDIPGFLREGAGSRLATLAKASSDVGTSSATPERQRKHLASRASSSKK